MKRHGATLDDIDAAAAEWVARRDAGLDAQEQAELEHWYAASVLHAEALARLEAAWIALGRPRRTGAGADLVRVLHLLGRRRRRRRMAIAGAGLAGLLVVGLGWWPRQTSTVRESQTVVHVPARRNLPDGSLIEHPPGAEVEVAYSSSARRVTLKRGEAHFTVARDPDRPFIVDAGGVAVQAVGTAFSVQLGGRQVEVLVTEGTVAVARTTPAEKTDASTPPPAPLALVGAGNRLVIPVALQPVAAPALELVPREKITERLAWLSPRVEFSGAPLSDVLTVLNRYNREGFVLGDAALGKVTLSGLFRADDVEAFTRMLETGFGIAVERRDGAIVLRKAK